MNMNAYVTGTLIFLLTGTAVCTGNPADVKLLKAETWTVPGVDLNMNRIPAGSFIMGSPTNERCRRADEIQHQVTISKPFYMGVYEVTQRQFYKLMMPPDYEYDAWQFKRGPIADGAAFCYRYPTKKGLIFNENAVGGERTDLNPMECVTWQRARDFCAKITKAERTAGRLPDGYVYRLPTEAEWEYACRAGSTGAYNVKADYSKISSIRTFAWVDEFNGVNMGTRVVGGKRMPNAWGLYDMHGNVCEWCLDWYGPYNTKPVTDPTGPGVGTEKVIRGGGFSGAIEDLDISVHPFLRSASRYSVPPGLQYLAFLGFRVVLAPELPKVYQDSTQPGKKNPRVARRERCLPFDEYVDKMKAGWVGQMVGVGWGGPTEFRCKGRIIPEDKMPQWRPETVNQFRQDDIYVEMTFLQTLDTYGLDCSIRQAGIDFANSSYNLWHANRAGRDNLRRGIAPPDSGHPQFNKHADDIDYQIEADYSGLIAPGIPQLVIELGEKFGRLMNFGDGMYAGQFVGGMYAEAFFEDDMVKIVEAGLRCIPAESQYAGMVRDMLTWYRKNPDDWQKTWQWCEEKYHKDPAYTHGLCSKPGGENAFSIDAKLNGAYIIMGLLYGKGDPDRAIIISTRCGQDSDCNPSNAGGILFATIGFSNLPERFVSKLAPETAFSHTPYDFPALIEVSKKLVRQAVARSGGRIEKTADGREMLVLPVVTPEPSSFQPVYKPGPIAGSTFTTGEKAMIRHE